MNFISGHSIKSLCHYSLDEEGFIENKNVDPKYINYYFIKTDLLLYFFNNLLPSQPFILVTHNSDINITNHADSLLNYQPLQYWYAQNVNYKHSKLIPIPIGIANPKWTHGNTELLQKTIDSNNNKSKLIYANFNINTNIKQRNYCLKNIDNSYFEYNISFETYLQKTSESYFSICPLGNGIDSHRIWESLYLETIPIVEKTYNIEYLSSKLNLPIVMIDDWKQFKKLEINESLYNRLINRFDRSILNPYSILSSN